MFLLFSISVLNDHLFEKKMFCRFPVRVFREPLSICVCHHVPYAFDGVVGWCDGAG